MADLPKAAVDAVTAILAERHGEALSAELTARVLAAAAPHLAAAGHRPWENAEGIDFAVKPTTSDDGTVWITLTCSACGPVDAAASPRDLGYLSVSAQGHYERKHATTEGETS